MILSPDFVKSEWTRFEYQVAQLEMLKSRHRIIPIMLRDVGQVSKEDGNLDVILSTVTYLTWPGDDAKKQNEFWNQLTKSLPKLKSNKVKKSPSSSEGTVYKLWERLVTSRQNQTTDSSPNEGVLYVSSTFGPTEEVTWSEAME